MYCSNEEACNTISIVLYWNSYLTRTATHVYSTSSDVSFVNDSFILNESLQGLESNESSQKKIRSFSRGHASGLA